MSETAKVIAAKSVELSQKSIVEFDATVRKAKEKRSKEDKLIASLVATMREVCSHHEKTHTENHNDYHGQGEYTTTHCSICGSEIK